MSEYQECRKRRGGPETEGLNGEKLMNGQVCHRIAHHSGSCLFDGPAEFDPVREEVLPMPNGVRWHNGTLVQTHWTPLTRSTRIPPRMVPNPAAEA